MHPLERLFRPRSVAVLGASPDPAKPSYRFVEGLVDAGYRGAIHLINPRGGEAFGRPLLPSLERVDGEIDLVLSMLGPAQTPGAIAATARRGARFAVIFTAGFAEMSAEGAAQQAQMVADAHASGMRVVGPNCMGIFSLDCGLNLTGQLGLRRGPVGMISQSGNVGLTVWYEAPKLDIGFSKFIGFGNQADIPVHEYLDYMGQDPETGVVVMYLEGLQAGLGPEFVRVAREVSRVKPIVAIKGGRTPNAGRAAWSHTASLAGEARIYGAAFRQAGIVEVDRLEELLPVAETLVRCPPFRGRRIAVVGSGGGHSILATDAVELNGFEVPPFSAEVIREMRAKLPPWAPVANPVDMTGAFLEDLALFADLTRVALREPEAMGGSLNYGFYGFHDVSVKDRNGLTYEGAAPRLGQVQRELGKPIVFYAPYARDGLACFRSMRQAGVPCYDSLDLAARCLRALRERAEILDRSAEGAASGPAPARAGAAHLAAAAARPGQNLTEPEALAFLGAHGLPVPAFRRAATRDEAVAAADALGYPVVLKVVSPDVVHKSEAGGVILDLRRPEAVAAGFDAIAASVRGRIPRAAVDGVLVTPYREGGVEVIAGVVRDPQFGPVLAAGLGGIFAEVLGDTALRVLPAGRGEIAAMLRELRGFPRLAGLRGRRPVDLPALEAVLLGLARVVLAHAEVAELDLNPILAFPEGVSIADARIRLVPVAAGVAPGPASSSIAPRSGNPGG